MFERIWRATSEGQGGGGEPRTQIGHVELAGLTRVYNAGRANRVEALRGIDLTIDRGESIAIMGPSGSGKSTLLNQIGLLDRPTTGTVRIEGIDTGGLTSDDRAEMRNRHIGFVFQQFNLIERMTAMDNVALALVPQGMRRAAREERALAVLDQVGVRDRARPRPGQLSGGQQQRVAIARALATRPGLILADEPTGALDSATSNAIIELLVGLNGEMGLTVIAVTHDPTVAQRLGRIVRVVDGKLAEDLSMEVAS